ncbi:TetR/AcrR family transcriptional regulator [Muricoccus radiodurans]|uniref:TetR/AcrR family transcriptional regulator n=1 Tax=Muricoccus radiodurans TaxID=2231721 RepID=UPI003CF906B9
MSDTEAGGAQDRRTAAERVREAAKNLFYRQGIHATGVEEVCRAAGATKMSLYRAYPSKDALVEAILRDSQCAMDEDFACSVDPGVPPRDRPMAFIRAAVAMLRTPGFRGCPVGLAVVEFPDPSHPVRQLADAAKQATRDKLRGLCAEAGAAAPEALGDALHLLIEGAYTVAPSLGNEAAAQSLERSAAALLDGALPARPPG